MDPQTCGDPFLPLKESWKEPLKGVQVGFCPHTVTVYNRATIKGLIYPYYEYYSTVTGWGAVSKPGLRFREAQGKLVYREVWEVCRHHMSA